MKFPSNKGEFALCMLTSRSPKNATFAGLKMLPYQPPKKVRWSRMTMVDLDPYTNIDGQMVPQGETMDLKVGSSANQVTKIDNELS